MLESQGYRVAVVEHWNSFAKVRQDLFGVIDVLAIKAGETLAVQCTSDDNVSHRVKKIRKSDALGDMLSAGWRVEVHGWKKRGRFWVCRSEEIA